MCYTTHSSLLIFISPYETKLTFKWHIVGSKSLGSLVKTSLSDVLLSLLLYDIDKWAECVWKDHWLVVMSQLRWWKPTIELFLWQSSEGLNWRASGQWPGRGARVTSLHVSQRSWPAPVARSAVNIRSRHRSNSLHSLGQERKKIINVH